MSSVPLPRALYLDAGAHRCFGVFHDARRTAGDPLTGVVLCPQFGWEAMCSHRPRRAWAQWLAAAGTPALRIDYPGTGDSDGAPADPGILDAWVASVGAAAAWMRTEGGCARVAVVGLELGGVLATLAAAAGAPIDDLVLWAAPASGKTLVRGWRAFSRFEALPPVPAELGAGYEPPDGALMAGGYLLAPEPRAAIEASDLTAITDLPGRPRVLLLGRDEAEPDSALAAALGAAGADVAIAAGPGYAAMTAEPTETVAPRATMTRIRDWIAGAPHAGHGAPATAAPATTSLELQDGARGARETPITIEQPTGRLFGVLHEPAGDRAGFCALMLNAGALTHVGPNRMWVEAARRWGARGVASLRLDVEGIGEADGDETRYADVGAFYTASFVPQVRAAMDDLVARGMPPRFVLLGLCSGAYWGFHAALQDERVAAVYMVNPRALLWDDQVRTLQEVRKLRKLARPSMWRKLLDPDRTTTPPSVVARAAAQLAVARARAAGRRLAGRPAPPVTVSYDACFDRFDAGGARAAFLFSGDEPLHDELARGGYLGRLQRWPSIEVQLVARTPEVHTLRPYWLQRRMHELLDAELERELTAG